MESVIASVVGAIVVALLTLWIPELNEQAKENNIPIRCVVVDAGETAIIHHDAGSSVDAGSTDMSQDVTRGE